jgi:hypothetical protein
VVFEKGGLTAPEYLSREVPPEVMAEWIPRTNQIAMVELIAPVLVAEVMGERLRGKKVLIFVDSEPVEGALVKGYSALEDMSELTGMFWERIAELKALVYICRVPTDSNPADLPSRKVKESRYATLGWVENRVTWPGKLVPKKRGRAWESTGRKVRK